MTFSILSDATMSVLMLALIVPAVAALIAIGVDIARSPARKTSRVRVPAHHSGRQAVQQ